LFQVNQEFHYASGILVEPRFVNGGSCVLDTIKLDFDGSLANTNFAKNRIVIAAIREGTVLAQDCMTIVQVIGVVNVD
jgi:hypothetical protein